MPEYQVIARKWRPQRFENVVGQEHVVRTLKNAILQNRTAHAYLFVGPRGIGKTTLARIFAKAMNCEHPQNGEPCCECRSCLATAADNNLDVIEIDAASHNSAAEMRELAEEVLHAPVSSRYKIYIIDEVHMLTKQAWNALLKTVEEPPAHAKFIFATTEVHQVLPTIISRCQRFDLLPIPTRLIANRLQLIADTEKVKIEPDAVNAIARAAAGGMRDAQSLLDQMIAFFATDDGSAVTEAQVLSLFGLTDRTDLYDILTALLKNRPGDVVVRIHQLAQKGKNLETLFDDILAALRGIRIAQVLRNPEDLLDESGETVALYRSLASEAPGDVVPVFLENLSPVGRVLHDALNKQVYLETILLKAMREAHAVRINDILKRLNQLRSAGELRFLDQLPTEKPSSSPAPAPRELGNAPAQSGEQETATPTRPDGVRSDSGGDESVCADEEACDAVAWFERLADAAVELSSVKYFRMGAPGSVQKSILIVEFGQDVSEAQYEQLRADLHSYQKLLQNLTGDWTSSVVFRRKDKQEAHPAAASSPVADCPASSPEPVALQATCPTESSDEAEDGCGETTDEEQDGEDAPPSVDASSETILDGERGVPAESRAKRHSIINDDPGAVERAKTRPVISDILDIFGGDVVDIHAKG